MKEKREATETIKTGNAKYSQSQEDQRVNVAAQKQYLAKRFTKLTGSLSNKISCLGKLLFQVQFLRERFADQNGFKERTEAIKAVTAKISRI